MADRLIENGNKIKIGRRRTRITTYENLVLTTPKLQTTKATTKDKTIHSKYSESNYYNRMRKRRQVIKEVCNNNFDIPNVSMVTLTFDQASNPDKDFKDINITHKEFDKFIRRVNNRYDNFRYIATFSRQGNGNWHYHMLCNFNNKIKREAISQIWKNGIVHIGHLKSNGELKATTDYIIKNMNQSSNEVRGRRGYLYSLNMEREIVLASWKPQDSKEFEEVFKRVSAESRRVLYETTNHVGVQRVDEQRANGDEVIDIIMKQDLTQSLKEKGYEDLETVYTHLTSTARFSDKFSELVAATPKQKPKQSNKNKHLK